jgi:3-isopropylmalate/(R)-2-methylmalate dehydratase small subunit
MTAQHTYGGRVYFLDRANINTDEIIPAKYLTYIEKEPLKPYLLEDLKIEGLNPASVKWDTYGAIVSRDNFGCGSSREMAVWAFGVNGIYTIIATNFARIFRENAFNDGMLAIELPSDVIDNLFKEFASKSDVNLKVDLEKDKLIFTSGTIVKQIPFTLTKFQKELVQAGGWVALANQKY